MWQFLRKLYYRNVYVIADCKDNSMTVSKRLYRMMKRQFTDKAKVFVFQVAGSADYGFMINPEGVDAQVTSEVMYNDKYKCVGFECLYPTVNMIAYQFDLPAQSATKLSVFPDKTDTGQKFFRICRP